MSAVKRNRLPTLSCGRCGHTWIPRVQHEPVRCAKCKSPYWNQPRKYHLKGKRDA